MTTETITWIPVTERVPDEDTTVLVCNDRHGVLESWLDMGAWRFGSYDGFKLLGGTVTHWAEMPNGPKS